MIGTPFRQKGDFTRIDTWFRAATSLGRLAVSIHGVARGDGLPVAAKAELGGLIGRIAENQRGPDRTGARRARPHRRPAGPDTSAPSAAPARIPHA